MSDAPRRQAAATMAVAPSRDFGLDVLRAHRSRDHQGS
jgi:hypothetical protein